jgi:alginate O-acetyltransferase complex protein AlgI
VLGLILKIAFADSFAIHVRYAFERTDAIDFVSAWVGSIAYAMQLYFDFSGYALIAIGIGRCFGFEFGRNFNCPYIADSMGNFWWRWHITLSRWIRDYLFFPMMLPATRRPRAYFYAVFALMWLLIGLWHGTRATFLVCYLWFGAWSALEGPLGFRRLPYVARRAVTTGIVLVGWILLRATSLGEAGRILRALVSPWDNPGRFNPAGLASSPIAAVLCAVALVYCFAIEPRFDAYAWKGRLGWVGAPALVGALVLCLMLGFSWHTIPFLYFQF